MRIEDWNLFIKEESIGIFGQLFKGEQDINSTHTARQSKSRHVSPMSLYKKLQAFRLFLTSRNMVADQECKARPLLNKEVEVFVMDLYKQVEQVSERSDKENLCEAKKIRF